jgi:hypothetical protein
MIYRFLSRVYPKNIRKNYIGLLKYLDIKINPDVFVGFVFFIGIFLGLTFAFLLNTFYDKIPFSISWLGFFLTIEVIVYIPLMMKVDKNAKTIEDMLPDALQLMSSNLKSGLTMEQALLASARPEFGIFEKELNRIGKEVATGEPLEKALMKSTKRVRSEKYQKTMELISSGLRSGGELAKLLDQASSGLKHQQLVDQKVRSNVMMYVIFIFSAICFGAPVLFGLSSFLIDVLTEIFGNVEIPAAASQQFSIPVISFQGTSTDRGFILTYIITSMFVSSVMGSLIIGLISKGKEKYGIRYIPILFVAALVVFFVARAVVSNIMSGLLTL